MEFYSTSEFAQLIGVCPNTLRNWDEKGYLCSAFRTPTNKRVYTSEQLERYSRGEYFKKSDNR